MYIRFGSRFSPRHFRTDKLFSRGLDIKFNAVAISLKISKKNSKIDFGGRFAIPKDNSIRDFPFSVANVFPRIALPRPFRLSKKLVQKNRTYWEYKLKNLPILFLSGDLIKKSKIYSYKNFREKP